MSDPKSMKRTAALLRGGARCEEHAANELEDGAAEIERLRQRVKELEQACADIEQAVTDPENQPSQYGTVTMEWLRKTQGEPVAWRVTYATIGTQVIDQPHLAELARNKGIRVEPLYTSAPPIPEGWQWNHVAATTLARFVNHGTPFQGDEKWAEIADVAIKLVAAAPNPPADVR